MDIHYGMDGSAHIDDWTVSTIVGDHTVIQERELDRVTLMEPVELFQYCIACSTHQCDRESPFAGQAACSPGGCRDTTSFDRTRTARLTATVSRISYDQTSDGWGDDGDLEMRFEVTPKRDADDDETEEIQSEQHACPYGDNTQCNWGREQLDLVIVVVTRGFVLLKP